MTREERYIEYDECIDRYLRNQMDDNERAAFEQEVDNNEELRERLVTTSLLVQGIQQEGMRQEGQAQLDAIKQMDERQFHNATQGKKGGRPLATLMKWASGIAAVAIVAYGIHAYYMTPRAEQPMMTEVVEEAPVDKPMTPQQPAKPTLANLADEFNKPFGNEPEAFADIRQQIKKTGSKNVLAVIEDIDKIEWPTTKHEAKGADDNEDIKNTTDNYNDCTHWYKALAYLKANDKESAITELNELVDHGTNEELMNRANDLLKRLEE